jgi:photosystem II stability/assembly factor-like uncharacterized protein
MINRLTSYLLTLVLVFGIGAITPIFAKKTKGEDKKEEKTAFEKAALGLKWRGIGPAFTSGRIADFAVNPDNPSEYFVAVASGHIWKTVNNGTTWDPVFDNYGAYSIGCLKMDPNNSNVIWAGTGENNHQRALGYGNGVFKSEDGGGSWVNMGLKDSRQIGMIAIDPRNSDVVYVAAEGSAWGPGGDRGLYKTVDGGANWEKVLEISENTGINNVVLDPVDPNIIYATSEQRRRRSFTKIGGGPESGLHVSKDAGKTWKKITTGLPSSHIGGMGIAISPVDRNVIYLIIEAQDDNGGFYRSDNRGASFKKMSSHSSSGQYYNEIYADPIDVNTVYSVETVSQVSHDGGKTWKSMGNNNRHVDDHALWIDPKDTQHFIIGGDGGVYESFDGGKNYIFKSNLPVTQFYRVAVDNTEPFYWVYGGTQDNNSFGGPSQNTSRKGVTAGEWKTTLGGDGFWQAVDPDDPNIVYSEYQYGNVYRYDKKSGESILIKPQPNKDELTHRWNWDAPMMLSPHQGQTLYIAANKLFKSTDRGHSWETISEDLTRNEDRNQFPVMGKYWPSNAVVKDLSTSQWGTIVSLAESRVKEGLIYVGTDDGLIQITEDGGQNWFKVSSFPGVPEYTYVSDIMPSRFDENVVFASFNNLKADDFKPYLLKSVDKGRNWTSISNNLPENGSIHTIEQDFVNKDLLFVGTEFAFFVSIDGGNIWKKFTKGMPDIAVRDIAIQERENDLVIATFGRGFYILDDYTPLREINDSFLDKEAYIFPVADALMYVQTGSRYGQGSMPYYGENPDFGANFTYYVKEVPETIKAERLKKEKELFESGEKIPQPTLDELKTEERQQKPYFVFTIKDEMGNIVKEIFKPASKGVNRISWNLQYAGFNPISVDEFNPTDNKNDWGFPVLPGKYSVMLDQVFDGERKHLAGPVEFKAVPLENTTLPIENRGDLVAFQNQLKELLMAMSGAEKYMGEMKKRIASVRQAVQNTPGVPFEMGAQTQKMAEKLDDIYFILDGTPAKASWEEVPPAIMPLNNRVQHVVWGMWGSTSEPTQTMKDNYAIVIEEFPPILNQLKEMDAELKTMEKELDNMGAPWTPGRLPEFSK